MIFFKRTFFCAEPSYKVFVINLDRSPERLEQMAMQLKNIGLDFERISAVDGNAQTDEFLNKYYSSKLNRKKYYVPLKKTEIGCYISHLKACEKIVRDNLDYAIILEDDIILEPYFEIIPDVINSIDKKWNYIKLIFSGRKKKIIERTPVDVGIFYDFPYEFELVKWKKPPFGTQAYAISKEGAVEFLKKRSVFYRPIDVNLQFTWETNLDVMGLIPQLGRHYNVESEIGERDLNKEYHYPLAKLVYKFKYLILSILNS